MLEVVIPGMRYGEGKLASDNVRRGAHCYLSGINADGYQLLKTPESTAQSKGALYPVNKYYFDQDLNDTADGVDILTTADSVIYYGPGEYITDQFVQSTFGLDATYWAAVEPTLSSVYGKQMYTPGSSTAVGTVGLSRIYVDTSGNGKLMGDTASSPTLVANLRSIGYVVGVYYTDSSDCKLRYRITKGEVNDA